MTRSCIDRPTRSRRGTWIIAGAVWCAASAGWWLVLPVVPRAEFQLPVGSSLLGLCPGGTALVNRYVSHPTIETHGHPFALELVDVSSGRLLSTLKEPCDYFKVTGESQDGRIWLLEEGEHSEPSFARFDANDRKLKPLSIQRGSRYEVAFSSNGRFVCFPPTLNLAAQIWDVSEDKLLFEVSDADSASSFSGDGRFLAISTVVPRKAVRVIELSSRRVLREFDGPNSSTVRRVELSADGVWLTAEFDLHPDSSALQLESKSWNTVTGEVQHIDDWGWSRLISGGRLLFEECKMGIPLRCFDLSTGEVQFQLTNSYGKWSVSRDGRIMFNPESTSQASWLQDLFDQYLGSWPFTASSNDLVIYELGKGRRTCAIPLRQPSFSWHVPEEMLYRWLPDRPAVAVYVSDNPKVWEIWDVPPRKSLTWFTAGAALLALPIAFVSRRRSRRLRAA
jgi:WD40 repeat protein